MIEPHLISDKNVNSLINRLADNFNANANHSAKLIADIPKLHDFSVHMLGMDIENEVEEDKDLER